MKTLKHFLPLILVGTMVMISCNSKTETVQKLYNEGINITPKPAKLTQTEGEFDLSDKTFFVLNDDNLEPVAAYFAKKIKASTGYELKIQKEKAENGAITLNIVQDVPVNEEGYLLDVTPTGIDVRAKTPQGIFYGMQTVMQLLPAEIESPELIKNIAWKIPCVNITDEPRFKYRGQHLDVCRHFFDIDHIKKQLDVLAMYKINKFHWHLTEDQGWRIESKVYPKLNEIAAKRVEGEGNTYGPFYFTHEQIKEVVAYAKERFIEVIPEIELPGHAVAALTAYPEFSCTGGPFEVRNIWGISNDIFCAGNDSTFEFLTNIIEEAIPLFESEYFHIGGDEAPKARWKECPKCQARIKELGIKGDKEHTAEEKLQSYFVQRMEKVLLKHNKKMIGWDEILEGGLAPTATVMSWRGEQGGTDAANMGHDAIMTPAGWLYLDQYQGDFKVEPVTIGGFTSLEKTYSYEPIPEALPEDKHHHILGAQANLWAEYMYTPELQEYRAFPRVIALSEVGWSKKENKDYKDFERRIDNQLVRLDGHKINYFIPLPEQTTPSCNFVAFTDKAVLEFKTTRPVKMVYTLDGSDPGIESPIYEKPLEFTENGTLKIRTVLPSEKMSSIRTITIEKQNFAPGTEKPMDAKSGLWAQYFKGQLRKTSELEGKEPESTEQISMPQAAKYRVKDYREVYEDDFYSTILSGFLHIPEDGIYYFSTEAEEFWLDEKLFINNAGEVKRFSRTDKSVALAKGTHAVKIIRLGDIVGGWPNQWDNISVSIRKADEPKFRPLNEEDFK